MKQTISFRQINDMIQQVTRKVEQVHPEFDLGTLVPMTGEDTDGEQVLCFVPADVVPKLPSITPISSPVAPYRHALSVSVFAARANGTVIRDRYGWFRVGNSLFACDHPRIREIPLFTSIVRECAVCGKEIK